MHGKEQSAPRPPWLSPFVQRRKYSARPNELAAPAPGWNWLTGENPHSEVPGRLWRPDPPQPASRCDGSRRRRSAYNGTTVGKCGTLVAPEISRSSTRPSRKLAAVVLLERFLNCGRRTAGLGRRGPGRIQLPTVHAQAEKKVSSSLFSR
jgi:hypothetical protein